MKFRAAVVASTVAGVVMIGACGGCRRNERGKDPAPTTTVAARKTSSRPAGVFVRSPNHIVLASSTVRIPIELVTYMPVLSITTDDGIKRRMILDTGADSVLITSGMAAALRATTRPSDRTFRDASGTGSGEGIAAVNALDLGAARFEDFDADEAKLYAGADALLGWPLWRNLLVTIDYPGRVLVLTQGSLPEPDGKNVLRLEFDQDRLMVLATLEGRETWLNLDTGWGVGDVVELTDATAARVEWASPAVPTMATDTAQGRALQKLGRLSGDLVLGRYRFVRPLAGTNGGLSADLVGAVALAKFVVTLDLKNMRVRLDRPTDEPIAPEPVFVAGFDCELRSSPLKVIGVLAGSEAERVGLRVGDLLLTVDSKPALDGLLAHDGGDFELEVERAGERMNMTVPMTKLVP